MKILDANIFIYAPQTAFAHLRPLLFDAESVISDFTRLEVLGYSQLKLADKHYFEAIFQRITRISVNESVINQAILLRQSKKMSVGDSIIAATAVLNGLDLYTRNDADFAHIKGLRIINPV
jgi:toxin FitB